ncbi:hypothetical protein M0R88_00275 [Halorussus gelatinilyticus]|uniref:PQQ-binding-like beta-propeller repeat protein n=1 Tax=Halorussus gelatinilyticus TaxID=2937524 RepID=A0A8U0IIN6_9EURY|nr:hypothetical protein [Halorussus gelatinilyticus]UPW00555.1 hypothetical protein M0R88_00275 [Halorussus gelatinilyticus]
MKKSVFLAVVLLSSMAVPVGTSAGQPADHRVRAGTVDDVREPTQTEWNVTVNETESIPNRLDSSNGFVFVGGASFPSSGPTISPAVHVLVGNNTTNLAASKVVADAEWTEKSPKRFDGRAVGDTLVVRYGRTISAVAKRGGTWKEFDLGTLDGQFEKMFATDSAVFVVSRAGIRKYGVGTKPTELARYDTEYELRSASYTDGTITFETLDDTECQAEGASGCFGGIGDGSRYGALDTDLNERWTKFVADDSVTTEQVGDLLLTRAGNESTFYARDVATGEPAWTWEAPNNDYFAERMHGDVEFWSSHSRAFVVDSDTGKERWSYHSDNVRYESSTRLLQYVDGEYVLRNYSTGEVLARHSGPAGKSKWNHVATMGGGAYLSFTVDPAPTRVFVNTTTGETVATFDPPKRIAAAYEKAKEMPNEVSYLTYTAGTMGPPGSFYMKVGIRGETGTRDLHKESVFIRPTGHEWFEIEAAPSNQKLNIKTPIVQTDGVLLYSAGGQKVDVDGVNRSESVHVRDLNGTYLGQATFYRTDLGKPMSESKEIPGRSLENQYNEKLTRDKYQVEMAANGPTGEVLYIEPYGIDGDERKVLRFVIGDVSPENVTGSVEVTCHDGGPRAVLTNPTSIPLVYSVGGTDEVTLGADESRTIELSGDGEYTFAVTTTSGDPVQLDLTASGDNSVRDGDTVVTNCGRETEQAMADETRSADDAPETGGSVPGFTPLSSVLALLAVVCLRHAVGKR